MTGKDPNNTERIRKLLGVSNELAGKVWRQLPLLQIVGIALGAAAIIGAGYALWKNRMSELPSLGIVALVVIALIAAKLILAQLDKRRLYHKRLDELALGVAITFIGWIAAGVHLLLFDRLFLNHGKWETAPNQAAPIFDAPGPRLHVADDPPAGIGADIPPIAQAADAPSQDRVS